MKYSFTQYLLRVIAYTIDVTITIAILCLPLIPLSIISNRVYPIYFILTFIISFLCFSIFGFGYFLLKDGIKGGSLGKRLVKLKVVHIDSKEDCTFLQSFVRNFFFMLIGSIDALVPFFTANGQKASDIIAKTVVVKK